MVGLSICPVSKTEIYIWVIGCITIFVKNSDMNVQQFNKHKVLC